MHKLRLDMSKRSIVDLAASDCSSDELAARGVGEERALKSSFKRPKTRDESTSKRSVDSTRRR